MMSGKKISRPQKKKFPNTQKSPLKKKKSPNPFRKSTSVLHSFSIYPIYLRSCRTQKRNRYFSFLQGVLILAKVIVLIRDSFIKQNREKFCVSSFPFPAVAV